MTYDLKLATICDHRVFKEPVTLNSDRRTITTSKPLSSLNIDMYASDDIVPKTAYFIMEIPDQTLQSGLNKKIVFKNEWKAIEDYFEITYITIKNYCPKCIGLGQIDDINYGNTGDLLVNRNENLLLQNVEKFTITELRSNPFQLFVGTGLVNLIGQRVYNQPYIVSRVTQEISNTLQVFKGLQNQYMSTGRTMSQGETLDVVENVKVSFDTNDSSILRANIAVRAKSGQTVNFTQFLQIA